MNPVRDAIISALKADAPLMAMVSGVFYKLAPYKQALPYVIVSKQSGSAQWAMGGANDHIHWGTWLVKGVGTQEVAEDIDARCRAVLTDAELVIAGHDHLYLRWETDVDMIDPSDGEQYNHVGAVYRVAASPS